MERVEFKCPGDCSRCELIASGRVQMVPCVLDQIFHRVQSFTDKLNELNEKVLGLEAKIDALGGLGIELPTE